MDPNSSNNENFVPSSPSENLESALFHTINNLLSFDEEVSPPSPDGKDPAAPEERYKARSRERHSPEFSDASNACRFVSLHHTSLRYVPLWAHWMLWDGKRWSPDIHDNISNFARATIQSFRDEALALPYEQRRRSTQLFDHADRSDNPKRLQAMLDLARHDPAIIATPQTFNSDPLLLNVLNGIIDLRSNRLQPHNPHDFITHLAPVTYDPSACSPVWDKFLSDITNHDPDVQHYLQLAIGYSLTASIQEQVIFLLHGSGCNGKSVFLNAIRFLLGDYADYTFCHLVTSRSRTAASAPIPVALLGKRLVITPEIEPDRTFDTHAIKLITGGEPLTTTAKTLPPSFPQHGFKLWIATNHLPSIRDYSAAAWRRIKLIPFSVSFLGCEDTSLATKLQASAPAILNWAIQGCLTWQRHGLLEPHCVERANAGYQDQEDELRSFLLDCCEFGPDKHVKAKELYQAYHQWCQFNEQAILSNELFGRRILAHGYLRERKKTGKIYLGIGLAPFTPLS